MNRGKHEGTIWYDDARKAWRAEITIAGKKYEKQSKDKKKVVAWLRDMEMKAARGIPISLEKMTLDAFLSDWIKIKTGIDTEEPDLKVKTWESYDLARRRILPYLGNVRVKDIKAKHLEDCYAGLRVGRESGRPLSASSVRQCHALLHAAFQDAVRQERLGVNPADNVIAKPRPKVREIAPLSADQMSVLFEATENEPHHALWVLLCTTGLRVGEATGLTWGDVDLDKRCLVVRQALQAQQGGKGLRFVSPKTKGSRRPVPLLPETVQTLKEHYMRCGRPASEKLVFTTSTGNPIDPSDLWRSFQATLRRHGLPRVRVHDLRHSYASYLVSRGVPMKQVQVLLGHSSYQMTANVYSHLDPALDHQAISQMSGIFRKKASESEQVS